MGVQRQLIPLVAKQHVVAVDPDAFPILLLHQLQAGIRILQSVKSFLHHSAAGGVYRCARNPAVQQRSVKASRVECVLAVPAPAVGIHGGVSIRHQHRTPQRKPVAVGALIGDHPDVFLQSPPAAVRADVQRVHRGGGKEGKMLVEKSRLRTVSQPQDAPQAAVPVPGKLLPAVGKPGGNFGRAVAHLPADLPAGETGQNQRRRFRLLPKFQIPQKKVAVNQVLLSYDRVKLAVAV